MLTESTLLLFTLLMVAAASGWAFARYLDRQVRGEPEEDPPLSQGYLRGLNLLLNQETDKALDLFVRMIATDDEALDTHFALGSLFRRRGEVERAIRIHQNILARPSLTASQRDAALFALGEDYLKAGLLDRAESIFRQLSESADDPEAAMHHLIGIHESLGDWEKALQVREELQQVTGDNQTLEIGHYLCELAENARRRGDREGARRLLRQAQKKGRGGLMRGAWVRARLAEEEGDPAKAWRLLERVAQTDTALLPDLLPDLLRVAGAREDLRRLDTLLRTLAHGDPAVMDRLAYAGIVTGLMEPPVVREAVEAYVTGNDTLTSLVDPEELKQDDEHAREALLRITGGLRRLAMSLPRYRCTDCGYSTQRLSWQCPSCKAWQTSRPLIDFPYQALLTGGDSRPAPAPPTS